MTQEKLLETIKNAFENVKLEDGIGIWEAQGIDDYADLKTIGELRKRDERDNWENLSYQDLAKCSSSLSFLDEKGMRFYLPKYMIFDILSKEIYKNQANYSPDILFTLGYKLDEEYQQKRFSLLDQKQMLTIIAYLKFKLKDIELKHKYSANSTGSKTKKPASDADFEDINGTITEWKRKLQDKIKEDQAKKK
jgi:hypothetical protein